MKSAILPLKSHAPANKRRKVVQRPGYNTYPRKPQSFAPDGVATGKAEAVGKPPQFLRIPLLPTLLQAERVYVVVIRADIDHPVHD